MTINEPAERELAERFASLTHSLDDSDWGEVGRLAHRRRAPRRRAVLAVVGVAAAVAFAAPAFGLGGKLVRLFENAEPAPPKVQRSFAGLDAGAPPGFRSSVQALQTRKIVLPNGVALWVAPTKTGGFCFFVAGGGGDCDAQRALPFWPIFSIGSVNKQGVITGGPVSVAGSTTIEGAADAEVRFEDGTAATIPVVWLSAPINAGFFGYEVPGSNWTIGHRPTLVVLHDEEGNELGRDTSAFHTPMFRHGPSTGLVPCLVRGGGSSCFDAATGGGSLLPRRSRPMDTVKHGLGWHGK
jgi:hypothetical protein